MSEAKVVSKTKFLTITEKTVRQVVIDFDEVKLAVNEYLSANPIAGKKYTCTSVSEKYKGENIEVQLERIVPQLVIDEDFDSDDQWEAFCLDMAKQLGATIFDVPYSYFSK